MTRDALAAYDQFAGFAAATVHEAAGKRGDLSADIRPLSPGMRLCGPAFTVRCHAGDTRAVIEAVSTAPAGSVLVVVSGAGARATVWGGTSTLVALRRGLRGLVTDGAVRDVAEIRGSGWPVFSGGVALRGTVKTHPGEIGGVQCVGGAVVAPGDLVVADDDGVVVVPRSLLPGLVERVLRQKRREDELDKIARDGGDLREAYPV